LIGLQIFDKGEESLPNLGMIRTVDQETGESSIIDTSSASERKEYEQAFQERAHQLVETFSQMKGDLIRLSTQEDYIKALLTFFKRRSK